MPERGGETAASPGGGLPREPDGRERDRKARAVRQMHDDRQVLLTRSPFLGVLAMRLDLVAVIDERLSTLATDGRTIFADADFYLGLSDPERVFVIGHEVWHCALQHFARRMDRERARWNVAIDQEVNDLLVREELPLPEGAVYKYEWRGFSAERVYEELGPPETFAHGLLAGGGGDAPPDQHEIPYPDPGAAIQDPDFNPVHDERVWRRWRQCTREALQQLEHAGVAPAWLRERVAADGAARIPWQRRLARFVQRVRGGGVQWLPPSRRHWGRGLYLPSRRTERLDLAVGVDTSGSTRHWWPRFRAELGGVIRAAPDCRVRVIQHDTRVIRDEVFTTALPRELEMAGSGGTDLRAPFEHLASEPPVALILLTDGYGPTPSRPPGYPVLWTLTGGSGSRRTSREPGWGEIIRME